MYADHYAVPADLNIKLVGFVRWKTTSEGHWVLSLWRTPDGKAYSCQELYQIWSLPFWMTTRMSDLIECTSETLERDVLLIENACAKGEERNSVHYLTQELFALWGYLEGANQALDDVAKRNSEHG